MGPTAGLEPAFAGYKPAVLAVELRRLSQRPASNRLPPVYETGARPHALRWQKQGGPARNMLCRCHPRRGTSASWFWWTTPAQWVLKRDWAALSSDGGPRPASLLSARGLAAPPAGLEPATLRLTGGHSCQLSYRGSASRDRGAPCLDPLALPGRHPDGSCVVSSRIEREPPGLQPGALPSEVRDRVEHTERGPPQTRTGNC